MPLADLDEHVDDVVDLLLVAHRRLVPIGEVARAGRAVGPAAVLARHQAAGQRAPHEDADALVDRDRHQLVLRVARLERVEDLLGHEALVAVPVGHGERLHQLPAAVVRRAHVADLAVAQERVERLQRLVERRLAVPLVHLVEVDVVGPEPPQARLARGDQVVAREPRVVRPVAHRHTRLGRDQRAIAPPLQGLADDLLGQPARVHVGGVDEVDTAVEAEVDLAGRARDVGRADGGEVVAAAEGHRAERERGDSQAGRTELAIFHRHSLNQMRGNERSGGTARDHSRTRTDATRRAGDAACRGRGGIAGRRGYTRWSGGAVGLWGLFITPDPGARGPRCPWPRGPGSGAQESPRGRVSRSRSCPACRGGTCTRS